ncbi:Endocytosis protein end4 [Neolecta irregularis DAH-3]|uniref:Endocytosis protein end4 n=1 Tax=Neolecta irregularis (strain DAH-3) TaxID=1198029 RepID=A0A1U7LI31_NEOID|nr:Endocytosis protein end4 [Neolecta irregularis DAH-3]|eukprot:OLL22253.1 Endocytosis protein end4 [Neolecta irregularis DAH-3]
MIHKVLQDGHPSVLQEGQSQTHWIETCARSVSGDGYRGYGPLIKCYVRFLLGKLNFHRLHPEFNGTFEYEEYVSLKNVNDPNEGYETITNLMQLQDQIDSFQRLIFAHFRGGSNNECRIAALVPLVKESYGIYKFATSMLRAMHSVTESDEALEPLRTRYNAQHYRLLKFYYECSNVRYLTSLIAVPKLPQDPPDVFEDSPALPRRPTEKPQTPSPKATTPAQVEPISDFWSTEKAQKQAQQEYEEQQRQFQAQRDAELQRQQMLALQQQREFEDQQRLQIEQQRLAQEQLMHDQLQRQAQGRAAELEREILAMRGQYERDQLMLEQYDRRVKALEMEMQQLDSSNHQQNVAKDDLIQSLQEQIKMWKNKYEALAKLYSQLRQEHLDLLGKFKQMQLKAASAQEAIDKKERIEREMKTKNLELADMIRERDRARYELDKVKDSQKDEVEKVRRELRFTQEKVDQAEKSKTELSDVISRYKQVIDDLERQIRSNKDALEESIKAVQNKDLELDAALREKEEELEIYKTGMDESLLQLNELRLNHQDTDNAMDSQIDALLLDHLQKLNEIIDAVLRNAVSRLDNSLFELDSPMQAGNQNSTAEYLLSMIENGSSTATEFATAFNHFVADGPNGDHSAIIQTTNIFASAINDVLINTKGISRLATDDSKADEIVNTARLAAIAAQGFFKSLASSKLKNVSVDQKTEIVITGNLEVQKALQRLSQLTESYGSKKINIRQTADIAELVDQELRETAEAIDRATERLTALLKGSKDPKISSADLQVNDAILEVAIAITNAIARLIKAATESQQEIVAQGRGSNTRTAFYKRNNRWTEGLISAAKAVAMATNILIETADGVINGRNSVERLIVASNEVAAATAQLVAASRVKSSFMSKSQERLESASKAVTTACRALVRHVQEVIAKRSRTAQEDVNFEGMGSHEFKVREMEQQVEILKLENDLSNARRVLGEMRKVSYYRQEDEA